MDLALNNLQRLIYHKTQQTKPNLENSSNQLLTWREMVPTRLFLSKAYYRNSVFMAKQCYKINLKFSYTHLFSLWIELSWSENPANTYTWHTETLDNCFVLIRSQQCIPWSPPLEIEPAKRKENVYLFSLLQNHIKIWLVVLNSLSDCLRFNSWLIK